MCTYKHTHIHLKNAKRGTLIQAYRYNCTNKSIYRDTYNHKPTYDTHTHTHPHCILWRIYCIKTHKNPSAKLKIMIRNDAAKSIEVKRKIENKWLAELLGCDPKMSHRMFTICAQNDSVKAADFEAQQQTGTEREREGERFRVTQNPGSAVTSTTSICCKKLHQSSGIDPLGEGKLRGKTPQRGTQSSWALRFPSKPRRPVYTSPDYHNQTSALNLCQGVYNVR